LRHKKGCGVGNQISSFGSSTVWSKKQKKTFYYFYNSLEPEPKFQAPAPKNVWFRLQVSKIAWAPAPLVIKRIVDHAPRRSLYARTLLQGPTQWHVQKILKGSIKS